MLLMRVAVGKAGPCIRLWQQRLECRSRRRSIVVAKATPTPQSRLGAEHVVIVHHQYVVKAKELLRPRCRAKPRKCLRKSFAVGRGIFGRRRKQQFVRDECNRRQLAAAPLIVMQSCGDAAPTRPVDIVERDHTLWRDLLLGKEQVFRGGVPTVPAIDRHSVDRGGFG